MSANVSAPTAARPKGGPQVLILLVIVLAPAMLVGALAGAGPAAIICGFVAFLGLLSSMGGSLHADLRRLAIIGPLIAVASVAPRLIAGGSVPAAFVVTTAFVFVAGLLPLLGRRYDSVGLALGMGTLFGYSIPLQGPVGTSQLVVAAVVGLAMAFGLRILVGFRDPDAPTRAAVAGLLDSSSTDFTAAFDSWAAGHPQRWLGEVLVAAGQYQLARRVLTREGDLAGRPEVGRFLAAAGEHAQAISTAVRMKTGFAPDEAAQALPIPILEVDELTADASNQVVDALGDAERATRARNPASITVPEGFRVQMNAADVRAALWDRSVQVRHALRTALAVLVALLVSTFLDAGDPLLPTLLMTTFAVVQVSWRSTLARTTDRLGGLVAGGAIAVLVILVFPVSFLFPIGMIGLVVGLWFITARPAVGVAGMLVMSVGINTELKHLEASSVVIEYVILSLIALLIGVVIGFAVIPAWRPPGLAVRVESAFACCSALLADLSTARGEPLPEDPLRRVRDAHAAVRQLVPDRENLSAIEEDRLERVRIGLQDLEMSAMFLRSSRGPSAAFTLRQAANLLEGRSVEPALHDVTQGTLETAVLLVARQLATLRLEFAEGR